MGPGPTVSIPAMNVKISPTEILSLIAIAAITALLLVRMLV